MLLLLQIDSGKQNVLVGAISGLADQAANVESSPIWDTTRIETVY